MKPKGPPPLPPGVKPKAAQDPDAQPSADGYMSQKAKASLADLALQLRDEQLQAKVVHYRADLETSPELDAITARVVAELQQLQQFQAASRTSTAPKDRIARETELTATLNTMLHRLFRDDKVASIIERKVAEASKRFARLFFESELHEKLRGSEATTKAIRFSEQALYYVFARNDAFFHAQLQAFEYANGEVMERAKELLGRYTKELRDAFLGRTTPELNELVKNLNEVLIQFFSRELPPQVEALASEVVRDARLADANARAGYKISADAFPRFRVAFERRFLERLVSFASDDMLRRVRETGERFRAETIRFVADPQIFSDICELVCDACYDYLYNDGFLDLPGDWRARLRRT